MLATETQSKETFTPEYFSPVLPHAREFFDPFSLTDLFTWPRYFVGTKMVPLKIEQFQEAGYLVVRAEIPGVDPKKDVQLTFETGGLYIQAERHKEFEQKRPGQYFTELSYGTMSRFVPLPNGVTTENVTASYKNGILEVKILLPKETETLGPFSIPIAY